MAVGGKGLGLGFVLKNDNYIPKIDFPYNIMTRPRTPGPSISELRN